VTRPQPLQPGELPRLRAWQRAAIDAYELRAAGGKARSFLGHQCKIVTDSSFARARIVSIDSQPIKDALANGEIAVIAGFQGVDEKGNITTLGRGGSDTTGVAIAAALGADVCEIYTDVDGVYTTDPRIVPRARKLDRITYEEMLELASVGRNASYSDGVSVSSTAHCSKSCFWMSFTRARILKFASRASARTWPIAAFSSWIRSFIQSSETWCWMMNSISSWRGAPAVPPDNGLCAASSASRCR